MSVRVDHEKLLETTDMTDRKDRPTAATKWSDPVQFRVWSNSATYDGDPLPWRCIAAFCYLQEVIDFLTYCEKRNATVVFQSPTGCEIRKPKTYNYGRQEVCNYGN